MLLFSHSVYQFFTVLLILGEMPSIVVVIVFFLAVTVCSMLAQLSSMLINFYIEICLNETACIAMDHMPRSDFAVFSFDVNYLLVCYLSEESSFVGNCFSSLIALLGPVFSLGGWNTLAEGWFQACSETLVNTSC